MSRLLQVSIPDQEIEALKPQAEGQTLSVADHARGALHETDEQRPIRRMEEKLRAIRKAIGYSFPTANIDEMNQDIEQGYSS